MDTDDQQIGRVLSRREVLAILGAGGVTMLVGCGPQQSASTAATATTAAPVATAATQGTSAAPTLNAEAQSAVAIGNNPSAVASQEAEVSTAEAANTAIAASNGGSVPACVVRPEVTEGPYYVDEDLVRADIRTDPTTGTAKDGTPLVITFDVSQVSSGSCTPLQGATVDIWHCDAAGSYSDVSDPGFNTVGQKWLRGSQVTDANGKVSFTTIYPGWYASRAVHIHYKVHPNDTSVFTSQLFFDDALSDQVLTQAVYNKGQRDTLNSTDSIYQDLMLLTVAKTDQGYATTFPIGIDLSTLGTGANGGGGPGGPPPNGTPGQRPGGPPPNGTQQPSTTQQPGG